MALISYHDKGNGVAALRVFGGSAAMLAAQAAANPALIPAPDGVSARTHYGVWGGAGWTLAERPALPELPAMSAGVEAVVAGYPEGSAVTIHSEITGQQAGAGVIEADGELRLTLAAGPWRIVVKPPFPYLSQDVAVEVSE